MNDTTQARQSLAAALARASDYLASRMGAADIEVKTIGQIVKRYGDQLSNMVYDVFNGNSDPVDFRRAHKALLREVAPQVYSEGMNEGGIAEDAQDEEDKAAMSEAVDDWLGSQLSFVNDFSKAIGEARKDKEQRPAILDRVEMWVNSLRDFGSQGKAYANGNEKGTWILGDAEHCKSCLRYAAMKPHRMSWWLARDLPRSSDLECGGFNCACDIVDSEGNSLL